MQETLEIGSRQWLPLAIAAAIIGAACVAWSLWRSPVRGPAVWLSAMFKLLAIASIALYLVEPLVRSKRPKPGANALAVVVDNSRSMSIRAPGQSDSLEDKLKAALQRDAAWHVRAAQDFAVRLYAFDARLRAIDSFEQIKFDGNSSALGNAVETVRSRFADRPAAGILVFTDGMNTDALPSMTQAAEEHLPVYPIVDLGRDQLRDISVTEPTVTQSAFELSPVQVEAAVQCQGFRGRPLVVRLIDERGTTLQEQTLTPDSDTYHKRLRFQFRPQEPGIQFVRVRAMLKSEDSPSLEMPPSRAEVTTANNQRLVAIDRGGGPYRILYVAGRTNWDYKFFRRAVVEDQELRLAGLIRIARKEAKFGFRDRAVDSTNPLFAGFEEDQDAAEQYDEPILLRMGELDEEELKGGFPKTEDDLYRFDALVLDDIDAKFFTQEQMLLIRQFVASRGGGLLMLGGSEAFERGGYRDTPVGDLLPVYLRSQRASVARAGSEADAEVASLGGGSPDAADNPGVAFRLTREGSLEPWMRLRPSESDEAKRISEMPRFATWNSVRDIKPGASILAVLGGDGETPWPAMVTQNFGSGRVAALTVGDMWRWTMRRAREDSYDLAQYWRQVARWLTSDVPRRVELEIKPPKSFSDPQTITIHLRDEYFHPLDNAEVEVNVMPPDGKLVRVDATPDRQQPGVMLANFWSQTDGPYVVSVKASQSDGTLIGEVESGWSAEPSANEFRSLSPDLDQLAALAKESGGQLVDIDELDDFVASLPTRQVPITETRVEPLWHRSSWLLLTVVCLCAEWGLRRWRGLP